MSELLEQVERARRDHSDIINVLNQNFNRNSQLMPLQIVTVAHEILAVTTYEDSESKPFELAYRALQSRLSIKKDVEPFKRPRSFLDSAKFMMRVRADPQVYQVAVWSLAVPIISKHIDPSEIQDIIAHE